MKAYRWCDRSLIDLNAFYTVCTQPAQFNKILTDLKVPRDQWPEFVAPRKSACVHWLEKAGSKDLVAAMCIQPRSDVDPIQVAALIVHEAVHLWQGKRDDMNERNPSAEFEAYAIQTISQNLMFEYKRQITSARPRPSGRAAKRTRRRAG